MFTKLQLTHFRAFESLTLDSLKRVNIIAGDNNIGKTGILEAVYLMSVWGKSGYNEMRRFPELFRRSHQRESVDEHDNFWAWLFFGRNTQKEWKISVEDNQKKAVVTGKLLDAAQGRHDVSQKILLRNAEDLAIIRGSFDVDANGRFAGGGTYGDNFLMGYRSAVFSTRLATPVNDAELVNAVAAKNEEDELIEYLRTVEPRLRRLKYLKLLGHGHPYVYADIGFGKGKALIPATQLGQGFSRMLSLFASLMVDSPQILLIDEFENGLQHDALVPIWTSLGAIARDRNIQIFVTTHSYECIESAHEAFKEHPEDLNLIRLQSNAATQEQDRRVEAIMINYEKLGGALENNFEIR